jgi:hypothetical protein
MLSKEQWDEAVKVFNNEREAHIELSATNDTGWILLKLSHNKTPVTPDSNAKFCFYLQWSGRIAG